MARITELVLDILKPHDPPVVVFAQHLAETMNGLSVMIDVVEIDDMTQTLSVTFAGEDINLDLIADAISSMGGSLHSIDKVQVINDTGAA